MMGLQWLQHQDTYLKALPQQLVLSSWLIMMMATHHPLKGRLPPRRLANRKVTQSGTSSTSAATIQRDFKLWVWVTLQFATHCGGGNASCRHGDLQTVRSLWHFFYVCSYDSMRLQTLGLGHVTVCISLWWWWDLTLSNLPASR